MMLFDKLIELSEELEHRASQLNAALRERGEREHRYNRLGRVEEIVNEIRRDLNEYYNIHQEERRKVGK